MDVRLAVNGFGNVGQGLATLLAEYGALYESEYGLRLLLTAVADRQGVAVDQDGLDPLALLAAKRDDGTVAALAGAGGGSSLADALPHSAAQVLVEAASTNFEDAEPGWSLVLQALNLDMDVVLASKGALALHWTELFERARARDRRVLFSATVGAPVPSLEIADRVLVGAEITAFEGILNGTTHQILSAMASGATYEEGVRQAQEMGIAETDPTLDVDGWDAAAKVAIVANAVFGSKLTIRDVARQGIRAVTAGELEQAGREGQAVKLIGRATREQGVVRASVAPERRPLNDPLGGLSGDDMGVVFHAEPLGALASTFHSGGHGGGITTAMTVLRDIFNLARDRGWSPR